MVGYSGPNHGSILKARHGVWGYHESVGNGDRGGVSGRGVICKNLVNSNLPLELICNAVDLEPSFSRFT